MRPCGDSQMGYDKQRDDQTLLACHVDRRGSQLAFLVDHYYKASAVSRRIMS